MAPSPTIVEANDFHALTVAERMRSVEVDEIWASHGLTPLEGIRLSMRASYSNWAWVHRGRAACVFGVAAISPLSHIAYPWMLTTNEVSRNRRMFLRNCREVLINKIAGRHRLLHGVVDARNAESIRWLRWLGFVIEPPVIMGVHPMPFHPFTMEVK